MIDPNVRITDLNVTHLNNFYNMLNPPGLETPRLIVVYKGGEVIKAVHTTRGRLEHITVWEGPNSLKVWAAEEGAQSVIAMEPDTVRKIAFEYQSRLSLNQSYDQQMLLCLKTAVRHIGKDLHVYPDNLTLIRLLPLELMSMAAKIALPGSGSAALFVFDGAEMFTSAILGFKKHKISLITSFDAMEAMLFDFLDWKAEYQDIAKAIEREFGPMRFGIFVERTWLQQTVDQGLDLRGIMTAIKDKNLALFPPIPTPITILVLKFLSTMPATRPEE